MKQTLLIDGDEYLFRACSAVERETRWDEWNHVLHCNEVEAWDNFQRMVEQTCDRLSTPDAVLCFSGKRPYFREVLAPSYKGNRTGRKPLCYSILRGLCDEHYTIRSFDGLEADDVMGILATKHRDKHRYIIVSQDKDMQCVPGALFRGGEVVSISEEDADRFFLFQTLRGDPSDGYPGCPGMGDVKATKWLADLCTWPRVVLAYEKAGLTENDALLQARLARILRWSDWDSTKKEPILWQPTATP